MPNWCNNEVTVHGEPEEIQKFVAHVKGKDGSTFSFDSIIPMPDELRDTNSPPTIMTEKEIAEHKKEQEIELEEFRLSYNPITQETSDRLVKQYGTNNWYDWCIDNWTCKWDATDVYLDADEPDYLQYRFDTPWGPPENIYNILVAQHPNVYISWFYDEPGMEFAGYLNKDEQ